LRFSKEKVKNLKNNKMKQTRLLLTLLCTLFIFTSCKEVKREYYKNGMLKSQTHYRFGKETGTTVHFHDWYPTIIMAVEMKKGKKHGKFIKRYFDNSIEVAAFYKNDLIEGLEVHYYNNGQCAQEINYKKGIKNGPIKSWHPNGVVKEIGAFVNDLFDGKWEKYDEIGMLIGEGSFVKGTGKRTVYDVIGSILTESNFVNNKKEGLETHYLSSGEIEKTYLFKEDRIIEINGVPVDEL
jgi:hypothetical protein